MRIDHFSYTKKKDGTTKNYTILILDEDEKYLSGLNIELLELDDMKNITKIISKFEKEKNKLDQKLESGKIQQTLYDAEMKALSEKRDPDMSEYVKKAYRCFLKENVKEPTIDDEKLTTNKE